MAQHNACIVCNSPKISNLIGYEKAYLCKCKSCNLVFSKEIPNIDVLTNYYTNYGNSYLSPITIKRYHEILDKFESYRKTNKLLDIGCGVGSFLVEAKKRGWEVYGTEFSKVSAEFCIKKGIQCNIGILDEKNYLPEMFDVITSFEVIEHINNPQSELKKIHEILRKDGIFYITTPNFNSLIRFKLKSKYNVICYPEHLTYYTRKTLGNALKISGFKKLKIETTGISLTRFKTSTGNSNQLVVSKTSDDEIIRVKIENTWFLTFVKRIINKTLTIFGVGDCLKVWYSK